MVMYISVKNITDTSFRHAFKLASAQNTELLGGAFHDLILSLPKHKQNTIKIGLIGGSHSGKSTFGKAIRNKGVDIEYLERGWKNQAATRNKTLGVVRQIDLGVKKSPYDTFLKAAKNTKFRKKHPQGLDIVEHPDLELEKDDEYDFILSFQSTSESSVLCKLYHNKRNLNLSGFLNKTRQFLI